MHACAHESVHACMHMSPHTAIHASGQEDLIIFYVCTSMVLNTPFIPLPLPPSFHPPLPLSLSFSPLPLPLFFFGGGQETVILNQ